MLQHYKNFIYQRKLWIDKTENKIIDDSIYLFL